MDIVIAGAGIRGQRLVKYLPLYGLNVKAFIDNSSAKWGTKIDGIECHPIDYFEGKDDNIWVMVSVQNGEELLQSLKKIYKNVLSLKVTDLFLQSQYNVGYDGFFPIGHFYNLYPVASDILKSTDWAQNKSCADWKIDGIDLREDLQRDFLGKIMEMYSLVPQWKSINQESMFRYRVGNDSFSNGDAVALFGMINILKPKKWIEVGSGWTSALTLDANEYFLNNQMDITFIEPYTELLKQRLRLDDQVTIIEEGLENVDLKIFETLQEGDVLFIDSTHVSKAGSDVNYLFFNILPRLQSGVYIHLHDIFFPFEYPHEWIRKGMVWNELYLLRSFLQFNNDFEIIYFQNWIEKNFSEVILEKWPFEDGNIHGGSFWMRKK